MQQTSAQITKIDVNASPMQARPKVCMLAPVHPWFDTRVFKKEARSLAKHGYEVVLIARAETAQTIDGVFVKPVQYNTRLQRFFLLPRILRWALTENADVYHLHNPDNLPTGALLKLFEKRVIYDTHEDFGKKILDKDWIPKRVRKIVALVVTAAEVALSQWADATIVTQEEQLARFNRSVLIRNAPLVEEDDLRRVTALSEQIRRDDQIRLIYIGWISVNRGLMKMLELLEELNKAFPTRLWLIGNFAASAEQEMAQRHSGWRYVDYLGFQEQEIAFAHLLQSDFGLILLLDVVDYRNTSPNKLYEYLMWGVPFVATSFPKWVRQLECANAGLFVDIDNIGEAAKQIVELHRNPSQYRHMSANGKSFVEEKFNWSWEEQRLLALYGRVMAA